MALQLRLCCNNGDQKGEETKRIVREKDEEIESRKTNQHLFAFTPRFLHTQLHPDGSIEAFRAVVPDITSLDLNFPPFMTNIGQ